MALKKLTSILDEQLEDIAKCVQTIHGKTLKPATWLRVSCIPFAQGPALMRSYLLKIGLVQFSVTACINAKEGMSINSRAVI